MIPVSLLLVATCYSIYTAIIYSNLEAKHAIPIGLCLAVIGNLIWLTMSKLILIDKTTVFYYGLAFDATITATTILIPAVFFGVRLSPISWVGVALVLLGLLILKLTGDP